MPASQFAGRVAIVHDWLTGMRGGEKVLQAILELFPEADLFCLIHNTGKVSKFIENRNIYTSFIDRLPFKTKGYRNYLPLFPAAIERFNLIGYDLIISSSHCVAHGIIPGPDTPHLSFVHSPMRYVWDMYSEYFPEKGIKGFIIPFFANYLRMWDVSASHRVDRYVANSAFVSRRIQKYYGRQASVVHPPCLEKPPSSGKLLEKDDFYLMVSAFVPYKRLDLAIKAFNQSGRKLLLCGGGPDEKNLRKMAASNIEFTGSLTTQEIQKLYSTARGLLFPGLEDFGIVPVEAQASFCPVIGYGKGGLLETVLAKKTGVFFYHQNAEALNEAVAQHEKIQYKAADFIASVRRFTVEQFKTGILSELNKVLTN